MSLRDINICYEIRCVICGGIGVGAVRVDFIAVCMFHDLARYKLCMLTSDTKIKKHISAIFTLLIWFGAAGRMIRV